MKNGQIIRTTSLTIHSDDSKYRETWKCKKGYRFVLALLFTEGPEQLGKPVQHSDVKKFMNALGWKEIKRR